MYHGYSNVHNYNFFVLAEGLLACQLFRNLQLLSRPIYTVLVLLVTATWMTEYAFAPPDRFQSYSIIFISFLIVLLSISTINQLIFASPYSLLKQPAFLICTAFIIYYTFCVLTESFWMFGVQRSRSFRLSINALLNYINLFTNLLYLIAILWMPTRHRFTLR
jgi:hypothetical protein